MPRSFSSPQVLTKLSSVIQGLKLPKTSPLRLIKNFPNRSPQKLTGVFDKSPCRKTGRSPLFLQNALFQNASRNLSIKKTNRGPFGFSSTFPNIKQLVQCGTRTDVLLLLRLHNHRPANPREPLGQKTARCFEIPFII